MRPDESFDQRNIRLYDSPHPVAVVTGSSAPRVGRRIAEYLLAQDFRVIFHAHQATDADRQFVSTIKAQGHETLLISGDIQDEEQVMAWIAQVHEAFGRVDVLVNSAAVWQPQTLEQNCRKTYEKFFQVNALGPALCCQHFGLAMTGQASGGAIVNIGDWAVVRPYRDFAAYFLGKGSIITMTQAMAVELASRNPRVRVNAILPGPVQLADNISPERRQRIVSECLLQREGSADDVAQAATFLATSPFVTGVCLPVDGGRTIYAGPSADPIAHPDVNS